MRWTISSLDAVKGMRCALAVLLRMSSALVCVSQRHFPGWYGWVEAPKSVQKVRRITETTKDGLTCQVVRRGTPQGDDGERKTVT